MKITFLGLGAMGSRMVQRLLAAGLAVTVWNRTAAKAAALGSGGAQLANTPREAVAGADLVFSMVRDDQASRALWLDPAQGALAGLSPAALAVECSTLSLPWTLELGTTATQAGVRFVDAPLAGSRPQAEAGELIFFVGGDKHTVSELTPALDVLGSRIHQLGQLGHGMAMKLAVNALFGTQVAALAELIGLLERSGLSATEAMRTLASVPVTSPAAAAAGQAMIARAWQPAFPIDLVAKDFRTLAHSAAHLGTPLPLAGATATVFEAACTEGFGEDNITGLVQRYLPAADARPQP